MTEEKPHHRSNKKRIVLAMIIIFVLVIGGSTYAFVQFMIPKDNTQQTADSFQQQSQMTLNAANFFKGVNLDCYVEYTNPQISRNSVSVTLYNETVDKLEQTNQLDRNATLNHVFNDPYAEMYLLENCMFYNNTSNPTPKNFNASLGRDQPDNIKAMIVSYMQQVMSHNVNFDQFVKQNSIESISNFYNMEYSQVVDILVNKHILDVSKDCSQVQKAPTGVVECQWNTSNFIYKINNTGSAQPVPSMQPQS